MFTCFNTHIPHSISYRHVRRNKRNGYQDVGSAKEFLYATDDPGTRLVLRLRLEDWWPEAAMVEKDENVTSFDSPWSIAPGERRN